MKKIPLKLIIPFFCACTSLFGQADFVTTAVLRFTDTRTNSTTSTAVSSELSAELAKFSFIKLVEREKMDLIAKEIGLGQTGMVDDVTAAQAGKIQGVNVLILGTIRDGIITARAVHVETSKIIATANAGSLDGIPALAKKLARGIEIYLAREKIRFMRNETPDIKFDFSVQKSSEPGKSLVITPRTKNAVNKIGENIAFKFRCNRKGFVTIIDIQPSGDIVILYPNAAVPDNQIMADRDYLFPGGQDTYEMKVSEPLGTDMVVAFFTLKKTSWLDPALLAGEGFKSVKQDDVEGMTRGITLTATGLKKTEWCSQTIEMNVVEK